MKDGFTIIYPDGSSMTYVPPSPPEEEPSGGGGIAGVIVFISILYIIGSIIVGW